MRALFGMGTPKGLQKGADALAAALLSLQSALIAIWTSLGRFWRSPTQFGHPQRNCPSGSRHPAVGRRNCKTGTQIQRPQEQTFSYSSGILWRL
jgi:hypothetical protein